MKADERDQGNIFINRMKQLGIFQENILATDSDFSNC